MNIRAENLQCKICRHLEWVCSLCW